MSTRNKTLPRGLLLEVLGISHQGRAPQVLNAGIHEHPEHGHCIAVGIGYPWHKQFGGPQTYWVPVESLERRLQLVEGERITAADMVPALVGAGGLVGATALRVTIYKPDELGTPPTDTVQ